MLPRELDPSVKNAVTPSSSSTYREKFLWGVTASSFACQRYERKASLLPAGITAVRGQFSSGEPVELVGPDGLVIARGLVNYDSDELPALLGRSTRDLAAELGAGYDRTVVHRDALVVIENAQTSA